MLLPLFTFLTINFLTLYVLLFLCLKIYAHEKVIVIATDLVACFHDIMHADHKEWFCTSDPVGKKLGSGGGTAWLLNACREEEDKDAALGDWLAREKRILLHAGGQSRRLPGYAPSGKVLTPIPGVPLGTGTEAYTGLALAAAAAV